MTASAHMPSSCKGRYRKIALVEVADPADMPARIDVRDHRVLQVIQEGNYHVGKTKRCAYQRALEDAQVECERLNAVKEDA
jgi:hypothetical protein